MTKFQVILCVLAILGGGIIACILPASVIAISDQCSSVERIYKNVDTCHNQSVILAGKVTNLELAISDKGNKYTKFMLDDGSANVITVFSYTHLPVSEGEIVRVRGIFYKVVTHSNYTFYKQIETTPEDVVVIRDDYWRYRLLLLLTTLFVIALILLFYRWYRHRKISKDKRYEMGVAFENYVQSLFDMGDWTIVRSTGDLSRKLGRKVESDSDPDFVMRDKGTDKVIAVECKYRSGFHKGKNEYGILWAQEYQLKNYNIFREKERIPVFIAIGLGGTPSKPDHLFLVPLYCMRYRFVSAEYIKRFERSPKNKFTIGEFQKIDRTL